MRRRPVLSTTTGDNASAASCNVASSVLQSATACSASRTCAAAFATAWEAAFAACNAAPSSSQRLLSSFSSNLGTPEKQIQKTFRCLYFTSRTLHISKVHPTKKSEMCTSHRLSLALQSRAFSDSSNCARHASRRSIAHSKAFKRVSASFVADARSCLARAVAERCCSARKS